MLMSLDDAALVIHAWQVQGFLVPMLSRDGHRLADGCCRSGGCTKTAKTPP